MSIARSGIRWRAVLIACGVVLLLPYLAMVGWLKWNEPTLVFQAAMSKGPSVFRDLPPPYVHAAEIRLPSGQALEGYSLEPDSAQDRGYWILHLHGNAESANYSGQFAHAKALRDLGFHVLAFDYRGFGASPGEASEQNVYEDAEAAYQFLVRQGIRDNRIILWGHSLGSGPAVELATRHAVAALVLFGAFTSVPGRGAELYPWLPVRWITGIRFDNLARISAIKAPVVIAHSEADRIIPVSHAERLFAAAREPKRLLRLKPTVDDGFGGHYGAAYEQLDKVIPVLELALR